MDNLPIQLLYFYDESGFTGSDSIRTHGWSNGRRIEMITPYYSKYTSYNLLCVIGPNGIIACSVHQGSTRGTDMCNFFVDYVLNVIPANSLIIMDNYPMHHGDAGTALALILSLKNCSLIYLPPYSPDLNPIENAFGTIKHYLKDDPLYFIESPENAILNACKKIKPQQIRNWYRLCGYE